MKRFHFKPGFTILLLFFSFAPFLRAQPGFQKVIQYQGLEDYINLSEMMASNQSIISLGYVTDSDNVLNLMRSDLQGNVVWARALQQGPVDYVLMDYLCLEGNGIFVAGQADGDSSASAIVRFDENGAISWTRIFSYFPHHLYITALSGDENGNVIFGGEHADLIFSNSGMVGKIRASDGLPLWISTIDDSVAFHVQKVAGTPSGEVIAGGNVDNFPTSTVNYPWLAKWSSGGALQWCKKIDRDVNVVGVEANNDWIYVAGSENPSTVTGNLFVARFDHAGNLNRWLTLDDPNHESVLTDLKLFPNGVALVAEYYDLIQSDNSILIRLDSAFNVVYAWQDNFGNPATIAGTDSSGMLHYLGAYHGPSTSDELMVVGALPDAPISAIPCGWAPFAPQFTQHTPNIQNYVVSTGATNRGGYANITAYSLPIVQVTACNQATAVAEKIEGLKVWPNPSSGMFMIEVPEAVWEAEVLGLDGRVLGKYSGEGQQGLDLSGYPAGMYVLKVQSNGQQWTQRLSKVD